MPKVTLEFDSIEEADELRMALNGAGYSLIVYEVLQQIRSTLKYGNPSPEVEKFAEELRSYILAYAEDRNLPLD